LHAACSAISNAVKVGIHAMIWGIRVDITARPERHASTACGKSRRRLRLGDDRPCLATQA
jgi:hypothetical protein